MAKVRTYGLDLAKNVFQVAGLGEREQMLVSRRLRRAQLLDWFVQQPRCLVSLEACPGAHYFARRLEEFGFPVKIIAPQDVKPYCSGHQKNDARDATAIARAGLSEQVRPVNRKSQDQLALQALFNGRRLDLKHRVAVDNQIRMTLLDQGIAIGKSEAALRDAVLAALEDEALPGMLRETLADRWEERNRLARQEASYERRIKKLAKQMKTARQLMELPGVGPMIAAYVVGVMGGPNGARSGREFSARAGLVPRQSSSGDRRHLGGITKAGDKALRALLVQGAQSVLDKYKGDAPIAAWGREVAERRGRQKAVVAVANKMGRHIWAEMNRAMSYA